MNFLNGSHEYGSAARSEGVNKGLNLKGSLVEYNDPENPAKFRGFI
jgi:hypothetical protein